MMIILHVLNFFMFFLLCVVSPNGRVPQPLGLFVANLIVPSIFVPVWFLSWNGLFLAWILFSSLFDNYFSRELSHLTFDLAPNPFYNLSRRNVLCFKNYPKTYHPNSYSRAQTRPCSCAYRPQKPPYKRPKAKKDPHCGKDIRRRGMCRYFAPDIFPEPNGRSCVRGICNSSFAGRDRMVQQRYRERIGPGISRPDVVLGGWGARQGRRPETQIVLWQ